MEVHFWKRTHGVCIMSFLKNVTVIGGGSMGSGIAQVAAMAGHKAHLLDVSKEALQKARTSISCNLQKIAVNKFKDNPTDGQKYIADLLGRITTTVDVEEAVKSADLVIEAAVENIDVKQKIFRSIDKIAPNHTIFVSNTSTLPITDIASVVERKDRFGGMHFFNPVPIMKLVEVIRTSETSDDTCEQVIAYGKSFGKTCITCKDAPGFIVNRLLIPYLVDAVRLYDKGYASAKDIDIAMKLGLGYPMGPLELCDYIGLDSCQIFVSTFRDKNPGSTHFESVPIVEKLISEGKLGVKSGEGFFVYKK